MIAKALILRFPDFDKLFKLSYDASHVGIGVIFSQERDPIAFYNEKSNEAKKRYSTYDFDFYAIFQAVKH